MVRERLLLARPLRPSSWGRSLSSAAASGARRFGGLGVLLDRLRWEDDEKEDEEDEDEEEEDRFLSLAWFAREGTSSEGRRQSAG